MRSARATAAIRKLISPPFSTPAIALVNLELEKRRETVVILPTDRRIIVDLFRASLNVLVDNWQVYSTVRKTIWKLDLDDVECAWIQVYYEDMIVMINL